MSTERLSFKEMCERFEVTPRTLRYYEYLELLQPERQGRARYYHAREIARMVLILRARRFGFSLEEVRQWLELYETEGTVPQLENFIELADRQLLVLAEQKEGIETSIRELEALRSETLEILAGKAG